MIIKVHFSTYKKWNIFSALIRLVENSEFSHSSIECEVLGKPLIAHATEYRVNVVSTRKFYRENTIFHTFEFELNEQEEEKFMELLYDTLGISYGWWTAVGIVISRLLSLVGIKNKKFFTDKNKTLFCSEFVWYVLNEMGINVTNFDPELDGPKKLYEGLKDALRIRKSF
jgi:hypothetical protein